MNCPTRAGLLAAPHQWAVFVVENGLAELRTLEVGQRTGFEAEVLSGLDEGAQVIAYPSDDIMDGIAVVPRSS